MAGALDAGAVKASTTYFDNGSVVVGNKTIYNFDKKGRGLATMQDVLNQSLNTGMVFVYGKFGREKMRDYIEGYGIGEKTGIDLPGEVSSLISNLASKRDIEYANMSFGQGIALTPIAVVRAFSSLANGGYLVTPHVIEKIVYKDGPSEEPTYETAPTKISKETSEEITRMLVSVFDSAPFRLQAKLDHYSIAAKTGTAQIPDNVNGGYYTDRHLHSFFGYFPAYDPKFLVFMYTVNPKGVSFASLSLAPSFVDTAKFLINYYNIPPDR